MNFELRDLVRDATRVALVETGGDTKKLDRPELIKPFVALGGKKSTLYRWIAEFVDDADAKYLAEKLPAIPDVPIVARPMFRDDIEVPDGLSEVMGGASIEVVQQLMACVTAAKDVMQHARREDGSVRLPKSLLGASEHLRRTLETTARLHESMVTLQKLDRYMEAIFAELKEEAPEVAQRVLGRLRAVNSRYRTATASKS